MQEGLHIGLSSSPSTLKVQVTALGTLYDLKSQLGLQISQSL